MQNLNKYLPKNINLKSLVYILLLFVAYYLGDADLQKLASTKLNLNEIVSKTQPKEGEYLVTKIVDGDTVHVQDVKGKEDILRFLSVDTLEKNSTDAREKCLAEMQTEFTKESLLNKKVTLQTDKTQGERDKYGRLLVYVTVPLQPPPSGETSDTYYIYNERLLETGNAKVFRANPPATMFNEYLKLQEEAQRNKLGMWNSELCKLAFVVIL